jgi:hypothetical protein
MSRTSSNPTGVGGSRTLTASENAIGNLRAGRNSASTALARPTIRLLDERQGEAAKGQPILRGRMLFSDAPSFRGQRIAQITTERVRAYVTERQQEGAAADPTPETSHGLGLGAGTRGREAARSHSPTISGAPPCGSSSALASPGTSP